MATRFRAWFDRHRALAGKLLFEFVVIVVGVTIAFALEGMRQDREEARYRTSMIAALAPTIDNAIEHNRAFESEVVAKLKALDAAIARGEKPRIPIHRENDSERPPTRAWDGIVATGAAKALDPSLFFRLSLFYTRQESFGERYVRYNDFTENRVFTLGPNPAALYDLETGRLKPEFAAHVDRLRDLLALSHSMTVQAVELREALLEFVAR